MRSFLLKFTCILFCTLLISPSPCLAQTPFATPFHTRNLSPVIQIHGLPAAQGGALTPAGRIDSILVMETANNFTWDDRGNESVWFDGETSRVSLSLSYGIAPRWEIGLEVPLVSHNTGVFDGFIEGWHDAFGLPQNGRKDAPRGEFDYFYDRGAASPELDMNQTGTGLGDVSLLLGYQITPDAPSQRRALALRGGIKLPTGDSDRLRGSGATDIHLRMDLTDAASLGDYSVTLFASGGILWLGQGDILADQQRDWVGFGSLGLDWAPWRPVSFKLQIDGHTSFYRNSELDQIDSASAQLAIGGTLHLSAKDAVDLSVTEDIVVDTASDVVFHLAWKHRF